MEGESAVTLGKFDGLHRGHQKLLEEILELQKRGYTGIVFEIAPEDRPSLFVPQEKRDFLESYGVDCMIHCPFVPEILCMNPEEFICEILIASLHAKHVVVGPDFRFGYHRKGDVKFLESMQKKYGYTLHVVPEERYQDRKISSTYIREALLEKDMDLVRELMGIFYPVEGIVERGRQLGRRIGIPTINLVPDQYKLLPPPGVYFSDVEIRSRNARPDAPAAYCHGITNVGNKPTVDGRSMGVETHLYEINDDLYGRKVKVSLREFWRQEIKFTSVDELKAQMERDVLSGKEYFGVE